SMGELFDRLYIFEMANNHEGSVAHGLKIIDVVANLAKKHQIKAAVKLQLRELETFIHPDYKQREDIKHIKRFESARLNFQDFEELVEAIHHHHLISVATPFDESSVANCQKLGIQILKLASCSATDWPLMTAMAEVKKPIIASTGGLGISDIDHLVSFFYKRVPAFALMHCVSIYPTPNDRIHMNFLGKMIRRYPYVKVGYSGHESPENRMGVMAAVAKGAQLLERHIGVSAEGIKLNRYSLDPDQADHWVSAAEEMREICGGDDHKFIGEDEIVSLRELQRGVYVKQQVKQGTPILDDDVFFAMPCAEGQLTSGEFGQLRAKFIATQDYVPGAALYEKTEQDSIRMVREIVHDTKGLLYEAGIELGKDYQIEISHHYGLSKFREMGCVLINLINREYCYKLLIMLPGQKHPPHLHQQKEETFYLLWGDITVNLRDSGEVSMKPGDRLLIHRGILHDFMTKSGAIVAEISTHSIVGDSYYENKEIARLDPIQRKTFVESW
ncbi:MAG TPA: N-acetylneuraminate synthase family protein, partial [Nitrosomonas sp.]|nr:N-acetylneuraminate synthase family protein [Nitrosomonas sp.]HNH68797.1 N-acetylneuraminate synthase family protein [Nitrosomonas sp.]HNJ37184.1 N-acetylneuraminate synthase family protein [Nitrosomonas sp.]HNO20337.1 N-acetylneuraminate synthase family protein [Nitrosomonas sp.]